MKLLHTCFFVFLVTLYSCTSSGNKDSGNYHEFGTVKKGDSLVATFTVPNNGSSPFKILNITKPCSCTNISYDSTDILPGNNAHFSVNYHSNNDSGYISKSFIVETSDSLNNIHTYYLRGNVIAAK